MLTPAFVIGNGYAQRASEPELVFEMGKRMAFLRPERFLRCAVPSVVGARHRAALGAGAGRRRASVRACTTARSTS